MNNFVKVKDFSRHSAPDLSDALLSLYECLTDPKYFVDLTRVVGSWLSTEHSTVEVAKIEEHSNRIWGLLNQIIVPQNQKTLPEATFTIDQDLVATSGDRQRWDQNLRHNLDATDTGRLRRWMRADTPAERGDFDTIVRIYESSGGVAKICLVRRCVDSPEHFEVILPDFRLDQTVESLFIQAMKLSHAEVLVLRRLVQGFSTKMIADELNKSNETIRSQLKSVMQKIGAKSQRDVLKTVYDVARVSSPNGKAHQDVFGAHEKRITLPDGRELYYCVSGKVDSGPAYLFFHQFLGGRHWTESNIDKFRRAGCKLISVSRAGYGGSSLQNLKGEALLKSHAHDFRQVLLAENVEICTVLADGSGIAPAYTFCLEYPALVRKLFAWDAYPPARKHSDAMSILPHMYRAGALASLYTPKLFRVLVDFCMKRLLTAKDMREVHEVMGIPKRQAPIHDLENETLAFQHILDSAKRKGHGALHEMTFLAVDWPRVGQNINTRPVSHLFHYNDDPIIPVKMALVLAKELSADISVIETPNAEKLANWGRIFDQYMRP